MNNKGKFIIYQLLLRVFGNTNEKCIPGGSFQLNGSGKFSSVSSKVLEEIKKLSVTHIWYTGVIEHVTKTSFEEFGIRRDNPVVIKGEAGSPYAIKDYYDVNPYLADSVCNRMKEFEALVERTHSAGLKVIIDFVPNHLAREYKSDSAPCGVEDFGVSDDSSAAFSPHNNFYYLPGQKLDLSGQINSAVSGDCATENACAGYDGYYEYPAKATGNDCFSARPGVNDWYETVKLNYGVDYLCGRRCFFEPRPKTWNMMLEVLLFWAAKGIDGFRCDMAEMVPAEFWHWAIGEVKRRYPEIVFIAEVYNPALYGTYHYFGGFDYLYDKVGLYDNLKAITRSFTGEASCFSPASSITGNWQSLGDMQDSMLNFLENHDEQRVASDFNVGNPFGSIPELAVSLMLNRAPFMLYFGQEFGEKGMLAEGFSGVDGRTSIFDYCSAPLVARWLDSLLYGIDRLCAKEKELYDIYCRLLHIAMNEEAIRVGETFDLEYANFNTPGFNSNDCFVFARMARSTANGGPLIVAADFSQSSNSLPVKLPGHMFDFFNIASGSYNATDLLTGATFSVVLAPDSTIDIPVTPYGIAVIKIG